ncbi:MAG: S24 family peptidase [Bacteroidota bacterium]
MAIREKNRRLQQIIHRLEQLGVLVKKHRNNLEAGEFNKSTFAEALGTHSGVIPAILKNERNVTEMIIQNLVEKFQVNELFIRMGQGSMFQQLTQEAVHPYAKNNIVYAGVSAFAGDSIAEGERAPAETFGIPGLEGDLVAFDVSGNSMDPILLTGDMVFCRPIEQINQIQPRQIYAIVADGVVRIKYIELTRDEHGYFDKMVLLSENALEHPPILIDVQADVKVFEVIYKLTDLRNQGIV